MNRDTYAEEHAMTNTTSTYPKMFQVTYRNCGNKEQSFLAIDGGEMKKYFLENFPGIGELSAQNFGELKEELLSHNIRVIRVNTLKREDWYTPIESLRAQLIPNKVYNGRQAGMMTRIGPKPVYEGKDILVPREFKTLCKGKTGAQILELIKDM